MKSRKDWALFVITMPGKGSWDGKWGGDKYYHAHAEKVFYYGKPIYHNLKEGDYSYSWDDGWCANVNVRFVTQKEGKDAIKRSCGFLGYDWMYESLKRCGKIKVEVPSE